jgi:hypothetical protein
MTWDGLCRFVAPDVAWWKLCNRSRSVAQSLRNVLQRISSSRLASARDYVYWEDDNNSDNDGCSESVGVSNSGGVGDVVESMMVSDGGRT